MEGGALTSFERANDDRAPSRTAPPAPAATRGHGAPPERDPTHPSILSQSVTDRDPAHPSIFPHAAAPTHPPPLGHIRPPNHPARGRPHPPHSVSLARSATARARACSGSTRTRRRPRSRAAIRRRPTARCSSSCSAASPRPTAAPRSSRASRRCSAGSPRARATRCGGWRARVKSLSPSGGGGGRTNERRTVCVRQKRPSSSSRQKSPRDPRAVFACVLARWQFDGVVPAGSLPTELTVSDLQVQLCEWRKARANRAEFYV